MLFADLVNQVFFTNACVNIYVTNFLHLLQILPHFLFANDANIILTLLLIANPLITRSLTTLSQVSTSRRSSFGLFTGEMVKKYDITELVTSVTSVFPPLGN